MVLSWLPSRVMADPLEVFPEQIQLSSDNQQQQVIVREPSSFQADVTRNVQFQTSDGSIATVDDRGVVHAVAAGQTELIVQWNESRTSVPIAVSEETSNQIDFDRDIQPLLTKYSCNSGACHGKQRGRNGFQLSLLGFDNIYDHDSLTKQSRSRRVTPSRPEQSLLLTKPSGGRPHGGGIRYTPETKAYQTMLQWIQEGATFKAPSASPLVKVEVFPKERILSNNAQQQLVVTATYENGTTRDVTHLAAYQSSESPIARVSEEGLVTAGMITGEVAVNVRYRGMFDLFHASVPLTGEVPETYYAALPRNNFIDEHIWTSLQKLGLKASQPVDDAKFMKRVYIDIIGRFPTVEESQDFLSNDSSEKREQLVDWLLDRPEYAEHWANKWADLLRTNPYRVGIKNTLNYDYWIRNSFRKNQPYDEFVTELLTAQGGTFRNGNTTLFRDRRSPDELTTIVSQLFLGIRLECAKCHHHPFEVYGQEDFYKFAAFFAKVQRKGTGLSPPISGSEEFIFAGKRGEVKHPLTDEVMAPSVLFGTDAEIDETDPRITLASWITSKDNHYFSNTMANRIWADLMGRGLVEPVDDLRGSNPASNAALLDALGQHFASSDFNIKALIKTITLSHAYSLSSEPNERNTVDTRYHSRYYRQRLRAEVLLDAVSNVTGIQERFTAMPPDASAKEIWTHRVDSLFLDAFGRPDPNQDPPCERTTDPTVVQTLHLMNAENLYSKVASDKGRAATLANSEKTPAEIVQELYLAVYSRRPTTEELAICTGLYAEESADRRKTTEDILWALLNTPEFLFKD